MWIEHGFEQFKSAGWQWQKTRITEPDRAGRKWLTIALATFWVIAVGGQRGHDEGPQETMPHLPATDVHQRGPESPGGNRLASVFCQGIAVILALLIADQRPACPAREVVSQAVAWN